MKWSLSILLAAAIFALQMLAQGSFSEESTAMKSNREQNGLRGRVMSYTEESVRPALTTGDTTYPEVRWKSTTEYDADGRILTTRSSSSDGTKWVTRNVYDAAGRLLKTASGVEGQAMKETLYSYDSQGRLQSTSNGSRSDKPIIFRYDEHGRKSMIATSRPEDYRPNMATSASFEVAGMAPNLPGGGTATTIYDEQDRGVEIQVRDAAGELVSRWVRTFDAQGRVVEEKQILEDFLAMIPAEHRMKMAEESGLTPEQLRQELRTKLADLMADRSSMYSVSYRYDAKGRVTHSSRQIFDRTDEIETTYNEHEDIASEITRTKRLPRESETTPLAGPPPYSETRYSYQYDAFGNWIEKTISSRSSPDGPFEEFSVIKRTLTYY